MEARTDRSHPGDLRVLGTTLGISRAAAVFFYRCPSRPDVASFECPAEQPSSSPVVVPLTLDQPMQTKATGYLDANPMYRNGLISYHIVKRIRSTQSGSTFKATVGKGSGVETRCLKVTRTDLKILDTLFKRGQEVIRSICQAIKYINDAGYAHRDLDVKNVLTGPSEQVWMGDFSMASKLVGNQKFTDYPGLQAIKAPETYYRSGYAGVNIAGNQQGKGGKVDYAS
ncbi:hypothetical protein BGX23_008977 [Mortierella sp. AD031]|nr:hypothetical protein BGX23_008977 [Mortierella sp. AD031]KAG0202679.1 hypothetical protein BGX33_009546 [Mortierella sp. NVP41]